MKVNIKRLYSIYSIVIAMVFSLGCFSSCVDLDITPKNVLTAEDIYTEGGIRAYMAGMYSYLPMEDYHYAANGGTGYFRDLNIWQIGTMTGEMCNEDSGFGQYHRSGYWSDGFKIIRQANGLINNLPNYPELADEAEAWIAEAKFIRAYVYFQLAKRYGGLPIIEIQQMLDLDDTSSLWVARSSHEDTFDFILKDLDDAIAALPATSDMGRANKYVAAGLKSRAAMYAGSTARYGHDKFVDWEVDGVLLQGIPTGRAVGYFKQAWDAAKLVEESSYELHNANGDKVANFAEVWEKCDDNKESMWLRKYDYVNTSHSMDALFCPVRLTTTYGGRYGVPLDWVELFDGLPLDELGHFSAFDEDGNYLVYDNCSQLWEAAEPRLQAQILVPGMSAKGFTIDVRSGVFNAAIDPDVTKFKKFSVDDGATNFNYRDGQNDSRIPQHGMFASDNSMILTQGNNNTESAVYEVDGKKIYIAGLDGPKMKWNGQGSTMTGILLRKLLDLSLPLASTKLFESSQSWIEMRYGEIILNRAEAAIELAQSGEASYNGVNMLNDAYECINAIRSRAGANLLTSPSELSTDAAHTNWDKPGPKGHGSWVEAPNRGLQILRVERYKELANEAKIYWDLMRWFSFDTQFNSTNKRGLYSFMFSKDAVVADDGIPNGKYIYDAKQGEHYCEPTSFDRNRYYEGIPSDELQNNPLLQKNRNQ